MYRYLVFLSFIVLFLALAGTNAASGAIVWEGSNIGGGDDAEEHLDEGDIDTGSSDLEMPYEDSGTPPSDLQLIGIRFQNVEIPAGVTIESAYIQFTADDEKLAGNTVNLAIWGWKEPNPGSFGGVDYMISSAPRTSSVAKWSNIPDWSSGQTNPASRTPDISNVIEELVNQDGWVIGNSLALIIGDDPDNPSSSIRSAVDGSPSIYVEYSSKKAFKPDPPSSSLYSDTWGTLSWLAGETAVSHDVYVGQNFDDVSNGTGDTFWGNQPSTMLIVGFPGSPFPDGLVPSNTYYWRVDEVEADGVTIHKGNVWSFAVPPRTSFNPDPADGTEFVDPNSVLSWTAGFGAKLHNVYFGDNFNDVNDAVGSAPYGPTTFNPGTLEMEKVYYWRVDEFDIVNTYKGEVWSFSTPGAAASLKPVNGAAGVKMTTTLNWTPGDSATSHDVYFGMDKDTVRNAITSSPEYKGNKPLGSESLDPGKLDWNTNYYWRVDGINNLNSNSPWTGNVWSFTTADFILIDDFEDYDASDNQIWYSWHDGLGYGIPGSPPYFAGNGTGAAVGDETTNSYCEEYIVHGGNKSMPVLYDNNKQGFSMYSEVEFALSDARDWTEGGVSDLSLWFRGLTSNAAEPLYVAAANSTGTPVVITHDDPSAAQTTTWTEWVIPLQAFADQGINLTDVDRIIIGLGTRGNLTVPGGAGKMYFDDIRLTLPSAVAEE
ncbi:MAG TPA: hypothetical protein DIU00_15420 [Phycisphaerales bacterium]|nr:hypothetical protein [Phycisphaerales bacterium]